MCNNLRKGEKMATITITETLKDELIKFLKKNKKADLITTYLFFLEKKFNIDPVLFIRDKMIFQSQEDLIKTKRKGNCGGKQRLKSNTASKALMSKRKKFTSAHLQAKSSETILTQIHKTLFMTGYQNVLKTKSAWGG